MRKDQFEDFKADVRAGLNEGLLSELYDLPLAEVRKGKKYLNRTWLECFISGSVQFFTNIVFQAGLKIRLLEIKELSTEVKRNGK